VTSTDRLSLAEPLDDADVSVAEVTTTTRRDEARTVMATVAGLRDHGVPIRDVAVVARDLDQYEEALYRAAVQYGITPVFWVQLRVTQTRPYAIIESVCDVLGSGKLSREVLCRPLEHRWCPASATSPSWPIDPATVQVSMEALPDEPQTLGEWHDELEANPEADERLVTYVEWLEECPEPTPAAVIDVLTDVVEMYEERGLPVTKANDSPALVETERDARAVVRVKTLVQQLRHKYADRLDEGTLDRSWSSVAELAQLIATQRPGRREHSNARAVDILEANDVWLLDVPYVITVGLVDGEWPKQTESVVPPELQEEILRGDSRVGTLAPRTAWTTGRDRDQFDDVLRAAGEGLIVTRHTENLAGEERRPSPLIEHLETDVVPNAEHRRLLSPERELPDAVRAMLDNEVTGGE
jgi:ATP-dependent helicase/nuclease subunit B